MKTTWWRSEFKVGLMTIVGLTLLAVLLIRASHWRFSAGGQKIRIRFDYVGGLLKNAPVHMYGVEIGKVTLVELVGEGVEVKTNLHKKVVIRDGYQVLIDIIGIVGEKYIEIINGPIGNPETKDDPLQGTSPTSIGYVLTKADEIAGKTVKTIDFIRNFIDTNEKEIHAGGAELKGLILSAKESLRKTMSDVDVLLTRANKLTEATESDIRQTTANLKTFTKGLNSDREEISSLIRNVTNDLDQLLARSAPAIEGSAGNFQKASENLLYSAGEASKHIADLGKSASQLMAKLSEITTSSDQKLQKELDDLGSAVANLNELSDRINKLVAKIEGGQGTLGKLITDESGYKKFDETMAAGKRAVEGVSNITDRLSGTLRFFDFIDMNKEYELSYDNLSRSLQNRFTLSLAGSDPNLYMAGLSLKDKPAYDLQVGRRFGDLMARVGAIRSKSSIGLDYWLFSNRLSTSLEVIDVIDRHPTVDLDVAVRLFSSWYFILGARDLASSRIGFNIGIRTVFSD